MKTTPHILRSGYDGKKCFVHARFCEAPDFLIATAQYLDVSGCDLFDGICACKSFDGGRTWTELVPQNGLAAFKKGNNTVVGCDATPMYHKKTGKIIVLGHTAEYEPNGKIPANRLRSTFYSVFDEEKGEFSRIKFVDMPEGFERCGNGCGQSLELENGDLLIPVYYSVLGTPAMFSAVMRCSFDGETLTFIEIGNSHTLPIGRGLCEPSVVYHNGTYLMTMRNDECGCVAKSDDGLCYTDCHLWAWDDGSILQNYNTQQHFMKIGGELYLVYTRRGADNDHVFRHRAPLFAAKVNEKLQLVRESEIAVVPERGARLGNFCACTMSDGRGAVMAAEWMQPVGCEKYGSDNSIFLTFVEN